MKSDNLPPSGIFSSFLQFTSVHPALSIMGVLGMAGMTAGVVYWFSPSVSQFVSGLFGRGTNVRIDKEGFKKEEVTNKVEAGNLTATEGDATIMNIAHNPSTTAGNMTGKNVTLDNVDKETDVNLIHALNRRK